MVLGSFGVEAAWMRASFFLRHNGRLGDKKPIDALRDGEVEAVERAARLRGARRGVTERLGPPPHDLDERELSMARLEGPWFRLHAAGRDPVLFGRTDRHGKLSKMPANRRNSRTQ